MIRTPSTQFPQQPNSCTVYIRNYSKQTHKLILPIIISSQHLFKKVSNQMGINFQDLQLFLHVYTGRQLKDEKSFLQEMIEDGSELIAVHKIQNLKKQTINLKPNTHKTPKISRQQTLQNNVKQTTNSNKDLESARQQTCNEKEDETSKQLFETAKFNNPYQVGQIIEQSAELDKIQEMSDLKSSRSNTEIEETEEYIINNTSPVPRWIQNSKNTQREVSTSYGFVPNNKKTFSRGHSQESLGNKQDIQVMAEDGPSDQIEKEDPQEDKNQNQLVNTLMTISSRYDEEMSSSLKQSFGLAVIDDKDRQAMVSSLNYNTLSVEDKVSTQILTQSLQKQNQAQSRNVGSYLSESFSKKTNPVLEVKSDISQNKQCQKQLDMRQNCIKSEHIKQQNNEQILVNSNFRQNNINQCKNTFRLTQSKQIGSIIKDTNQDQRTDKLYKNNSDVENYDIKTHNFSQKNEGIKTSMEEDYQKQKSAEFKRYPYMCNLSQVSSVYQHSDPNSNQHLADSTDMNYPMINRDSMKKSFTSDYHEWDNSLHSECMPVVVGSNRSEIDENSSKIESPEKAEISNQVVDCEKTCNDFGSLIESQVKNQMNKKNKIELVEQVSPQSDILSKEEIINQELSAPGGNYNQHQIDGQASDLKQLLTNCQDESQYRPQDQDGLMGQQDVVNSSFQKPKVKQYQNTNSRQFKQQTSVNSYSQNLSNSQHKQVSTSLPKSKLVWSDENLLYSEEVLRSQEEQKPKNDGDMAKNQTSFDTDNLLDDVENDYQHRDVNMSKTQHRNNDNDQKSGKLSINIPKPNPLTNQNQNSMLTHKDIKVEEGDLIVVEDFENEGDGEVSAQVMLYPQRIRSQIFCEFYQLEDGKVEDDVIEIVEVRNNGNFGNPQEDENLLLDYL